MSALADIILTTHSLHRPRTLGSLMRLDETPFRNPGEKEVEAGSPISTLMRMKHSLLRFRLG